MRSPACSPLTAGLLAARDSSAAAPAAPRIELPAAPQPAELGLEAVSSANSTAATVQRTFVSTSGSDSNPCTNTQPCRGFAAAIANTSPGGEVVALSSGGYGPVGIGMAVTIVGAPGVHAAITALTGNAIEVTAGASDTVVLRNLYLNGLGGDNGIVFNSGRALVLERVTVTGFSTEFSAGVRHQAPNGRLHASDLIVRRNTTGVRVTPTSGTAPVSLDRVRAHENDVRIWGAQNARLRISGCVLSGNEYGIAAQVPTMVSGCQISENTAAGFFVASGGVGWIGGSTVTGNGNGFFSTGGTLESFADNLVRGNTANTSGTITPVAKT